MPSAASLWISPQNSRRALGSTPAVGSSSSSSSGLGRMQAPSARRCFQPPDSVPASWRLAAHEPEPLDRRARLLLGLREAVDAGDELQVLLDRQVLVEAEALRHVADVALDLVALGQDVVAERRAPAAVGREQPAHHAQRGGLAGAVGAEEAVDLAAHHAHGQVAHHHLAVEGLGQAFDLDGDGCRCAGHLCAWLTPAAPCSATDTGWPTRRFSRALGRRLDAEHQARALLLAVDDGRRELGLGGDEVDARHRSSPRIHRSAPRSGRRCAPWAAPPAARRSAPARCPAAAATRSAGRAAPARPRGSTPPGSLPAAGDLTLRRSSRVFAEFSRASAVRSAASASSNVFCEPTLPLSSALARS